MKNNALLYVLVAFLSVLVAWMGHLNKQSAELFTKEIVTQHKQIKELQTELNGLTEVFNGAVVCKGPDWAEIFRQIHADYSKIKEMQRGQETPIRVQPD